MAKLIVVFRNFANAPENKLVGIYECKVENVRMTVILCGAFVSPRRQRIFFLPGE
jgi:hypothetical protein